MQRSGKLCRVEFQYHAMEKRLHDLQRRLGVRNGVFVLDDLIRYSKIGHRRKKTKWKRRPADDKTVLVG